MTGPGAVSSREAASLPRRRFALQPAARSRRVALRLLHRRVRAPAANLVPFVGRRIETGHCSRKPPRAPNSIAVRSWASPETPDWASPACFTRRPDSFEGRRVLRVGRGALCERRLRTSRSSSCSRPLLRRGHRHRERRTAKVTAALSTRGWRSGRGDPPVSTSSPCRRRRPFRDARTRGATARTLDAMRRLILAASATLPLCLIVEDLHWIDPETAGGARPPGREHRGVPRAAPRELSSRYRHRWSSKTYYRQLQLEPLAGESAGVRSARCSARDPAVSRSPHLTDGQKATRSSSRRASRPWPRPACSADSGGRTD